MRLASDVSIAAIAAYWMTVNADEDNRIIVGFVNTWSSTYVISSSRMQVCNSCSLQNSRCLKILKVFIVLFSMFCLVTDWIMYFWMFRIQNVEKDTYNGTSMKHLYYVTNFLRLYMSGPGARERNRQIGRIPVKNAFAICAPSVTFEHTWQR